MAALPLLVPLLAGIVLWLHLGPPAIAAAAGTIALAGVYGTIPYLVFLTILLGMVRPSSHAAWTRTLWIAPLLIAAAFTLVLFVTGWQGGRADVAAKAWLWGELALITGYGYAAVIWLFRWWWSRAGCIDAGAWRGRPRDAGPFRRAKRVEEIHSTPRSDESTAAPAVDPPL
jgi:hypothetical protein